MLRDPMEQPEICKNLWDVKMYRTVKVYIAKEICRYDNEIIVEKTGIGRNYVGDYATKGERLLDKYSEAILKMLERKDVMDACKITTKGQYLLCAGVYHALFIARVISESLGTSFLANKIWGGAKAVHVKTFPLFYLFYGANAYKKVRIRLKGKDKWYVSVPSLVYIYYVISRVNDEPIFFDMVDMSIIESVLRKLTQKDVRKLILTLAEAQQARELTKIAIKARYPIIPSWHEPI